VTCDDGHGRPAPSDIPIRSKKEPLCKACGDSGFSGYGTGYGDVCSECGGQSATAFDDPDEEPPKPRSQPKRPTGKHPSELLASLDMGDLAGLVERAFDVDFDADMRTVESSLRFGDANRAELGMLRKALDEQTDNARIAHRLYCNAREAREVFEIDAKIVESSMREDAVHRLQQEKKSGQRTKTITDADVESMMVSLYPDQYRDLARRRKRVEMLCKHLEELAEISKKRINVLDTLVNTKR
jgi:hypothetical protein